MAPKKTPSNGKRRPSVLTKSISFGEERNGTTRVARPGTSPTSPQKKRYPSTPPPQPKKIVKTASKRKITYTENVTSALIVKIRTLPDGGLSFTDGGRKWHTIIPLNDTAVAGDETISSPTGGFKNLPSILHGGINFWKNGNFKFENTSSWKCASRKDETCGGQNFHEEEWVYVGEDSPPTTPKGKKALASPKSPPPAPKKTNKLTGISGSYSSNPFVVQPAVGDEGLINSQSKTQTSPKSSTTTPKQEKDKPSTPPHPPFLGGDVDGLTDWPRRFARQNSHYYPPPDPRVQPSFKGAPQRFSRGAQALHDLSYETSLEATTATATIPKAPTKKAKKNKKAQEKKAAVKKNVGKRKKLPYVPKQELQQKLRVTRSKNATQFFALP